jgi:hypothetical protein
MILRRTDRLIGILIGLVTVFLLMGSRPVALVSGVAGAVAVAHWFDADDIAILIGALVGICAAFRYGYELGRRDGEDA